MADPRFEQLAETLIGYSCDLQEGEKILIEVIEVPNELTTTLVRTAAARGGRPLVWIKSQPVMRELLHAASTEQIDLIAAGEELVMQQVDAYIGVRGADNVAELSDVPADKLDLYESRWWTRVHNNIRVPQTKWVVTRWPSPSMAQLADTSTAAFEDFFFRVCTMDYGRMSRAMAPLKSLMDATDRVRLVAPGTDLTFSLLGIPAVLCDGHRNIPDGEVFTAPVRDSIQGVIQYNTPTIYRGVTHEDVRFEFENGKIVAASSSASESLERILGADEGARYVGEFAIGFNPHITQPMKDILFDEKIAGSIHLTPGQCYKEAPNGNQSQIHWDLVLRMTPEVGGGEVWFDDRLIRQDGRFVVDELLGLNPENLV